VGAIRGFFAPDEDAGTGGLQSTAIPPHTPVIQSSLKPPGHQAHAVSDIPEAATAPFHRPPGDAPPRHGGEPQPPPNVPVQDRVGVMRSPLESPAPREPEWPAAPCSPARRDERVRFLRHNEVGFEVYENMPDRAAMIWIPPGDFIMGAQDDDDEARKDERPSRTVYLEGFWLYREPVTNQQFAAFLKSSGHGLANDEWEEYWDSTGDHFPAAWVSWYDARAYCHWAGGDLPTEAQWEKGARGPDGRKFPWGNFHDNSRFNSWDSPPMPGKAPFFEHKGPSVVGACRGGASPYGCVDMAGNVWEWCCDVYNESYYREAPVVEPLFENRRSSLMVLRGGSWSEIPRECRTTRRGRADAISISKDRGFRCVVYSRA